MQKVWVEFELQCKGVFYVSACVVSSFPVGTVSHTAKPRLSVEVACSEGIDTADSGSSSGRRYSDNFLSFNRNILCCYAHNLKILSPPKLFYNFGYHDGVCYVYFSVFIGPSGCSHGGHFCYRTILFSPTRSDLISPHSISLHWWDSVVVSMIALEFLEEVSSLHVAFSTLRLLIFDILYIYII